MSSDIDPIELSYSVSRAEYGEGTRRIAGRRVEAFTLVIVAISVPAVIAGYATGTPELATMLLVLAVVVSAVLAWQRYLLPRRMWERMGFADGPMTVRMDAEGVSFECPGVQTHQEWRRILKVRLSDQWMLLYQHPRVASVVKLPPDDELRTRIEALLAHANVTVAR